MIALPAAPVFLTPRGLDHVGPRAFGYDLDFNSVFRLMNRIGIDVGGTNTDAVLLADGKVVEGVKTATTADVTGGIVAAFEALKAVTELGSDIDALMIGTTHFVNAVVQRRHLTKVAAIRVALPATAALPPFTGWPADLAELANGGVWQIEGGHDYDGRRFMPLDVATARTIARQIRERGLKYVVVTAMFSPLDASDEETIAAIMREEIPGVSVTCSHLLGGIGLLERENAAILNASLIALGRGDHPRLRSTPSEGSVCQRRCSSPRTTAPLRRLPGRRRFRSTALHPVPPTRCAVRPTSPE